jgi:hypothetical protein
VDPALVEDLRATIRVGEVPDVVWDGESPARATFEVIKWSPMSGRL